MLIRKFKFKDPAEGQFHELMEDPSIAEHFSPFKDDRGYFNDFIKTNEMFPDAACPTGIFGGFTEGGALIGFAILRKFKANSVEMSYAIASEFRGFGLCLELIRCLIKAQAKVYPNFLVEVRVHLGNLTSQKVMRKAGFEALGEVRATENLMPITVLNYQCKIEDGHVIWLNSQHSLPALPCNQNKMMV